MRTADIIGTELLEQLRACLPPELAARMEAGLRDGAARLQWAEMKVRLLEEKLRLRRIEKYGPGSEKLNAAQLELLEWEPGVSTAEVAREAARPPLKRHRNQAAERAPRPGRQELPAELERQERVLPAPTACAGCGGETMVIGEDRSERLEMKPPEYFVAVIRREKRICAECPEHGVATAPPPPAIVAKGLAGDGVVIDVVIKKYVDHLPLYRQSEMLRREAGVDIGRSTLDGWVLRVGELLLPLAEAMAAEIRAGTYIQADETPVAVQTHDRRGKNHQAYLWQYGRPGGGVVFDYQPGRSRAGPARFLGSFAGILQTDGYAAYEGVGGPGLVHAGCWAHARRKFFEAAKVDPRNAEAVALVARCDQLFALDAQARRENQTLEQRHALRQAQAPAVLGALRAEVEQTRARSLPAGLLGKAAGYTLAQWPKLQRFLDHPEIELSNNWAENSMRPLALGRKNWIHLGSAQAGPRIAAILSVVETCRRLDLPLRAYLADVLPGLDRRSNADLHALTPIAWSAAR